MFYTGEVKASDLYSEIITKITTIQPGETSPWWHKESSLDSDGVYTSTGSTGSERIVLILREGTVGKNLMVGFARDYTAGSINTTGAFDNSSVDILDYFSAVQDGTTMVRYNLNMTKDRIILHVQGDKLIAQTNSSLAYLGMPVRYDVSDKYCVLKSTTTNSALAARPKLIQDSIGQVLHDYYWYYTASPGNPSWGNNHFLEPLHFGKVGEGLRGELDGLFGIHPDGVVDGNVINSNGNDYLIIKRAGANHNGFPRDTLAMKMA